MASYTTPAEADCARREKQFDSINTTSAWMIIPAEQCREKILMTILSLLSSRWSWYVSTNSWSSSVSWGEKSSNLQFISRVLLIGSSPAVNTVRSAEPSVQCVIAGGWRGWCVLLEIPKLSYIAQIPPAWWQQPATAEWERSLQTVKSARVTSSSFLYKLQKKACM